MTTTDDFICFNCKQPGHFARACPNGRPAGTMQPYQKAINEIEHMQRIEGYVRLWQDGKINLHRKREAIAAENLQWYGQHITRSGIRLTHAS